MGRRANAIVPNLKFIEFLEKLLICSEERNGPFVGKNPEPFFTMMERMPGQILTITLSS
jgi:hypothetical protein